MSSPIAVVNVRRFIRRQLEDGVPAIYVGRAIPGIFKGHPLANPFRVRSDADPATREMVLARYEHWLDGHPRRDELLAELAAEVRRTGKPLGCWCLDWDGTGEPPGQCHAVVLAREVRKILEREGA